MKRSVLVKSNWFARMKLIMRYGDDEEKVILSFEGETLLYFGVNVVVY